MSIGNYQIERERFMKGGAQCTRANLQWLCGYAACLKHMGAAFQNVGELSAEFATLERKLDERKSTMGSAFEVRINLGDDGVPGELDGAAQHVAAALHYAAARVTDTDAARFIVRGLNNRIIGTAGLVTREV